MKSSSQVSDVTNGIKRIAYPGGVVAVCFFIAYHYLGYYQVPQNGMYPILPAGSRFLTLRRPYREPAEVARRDIVLFNHAANGKSYVYSWRVVGLPGDTVQTAGDDVLINGIALNHEKTRSDGNLGIYAETNGAATYEIALPEKATDAVPPDVTVTVPKDQFFVLGDNRYQATDSRYLGLVPFEAIIGKKW
jgi:signal peptidase I